MTLRELIAAHPHLFYPQTWYEGEAFMDTDVGTGLGVPRAFLPTYADAARAQFLPFAATLVNAYIHAPGLAIWRKRLWCADVDDKGQRVYVTDNGMGLEIHRHLHITEDFGVALWS